MKKFLKGCWGVLQVIIIIYVICITACLLCKNKYGFTQLGDMTLITINEDLQQYLPETKEKDLLLVKETKNDMNVGDKIYYYATANNEYIIKTAHIKEEITSPTFNIIKEYTSGELPLYHMDVYRLDGKVDDIGLEDYYTKGGICIIEWADMIRDYLPEERLEIKFKLSSEDEDTRIITITPYGSKYEELCEDVL